MDAQTIVGKCKLVMKIVRTTPALTYIAPISDAMTILATRIFPIKTVGLLTVEVSTVDGGLVEEMEVILV